MGVISWVFLSRNVSCGCNQAVCWGCSRICSLSWGEGLLPSWLTWLLVGFCSSWVIGLRASVFTGCVSSPYLLGLIIGQLTPWWLASGRGDLRKKTLCNALLEVMSHHLWGIPFVRSGLRSPAHTHREGITQRSEYQEVVILEAAYYHKWQIKKNNNETCEILFSIALSVILVVKSFASKIGFLFSKF